MELTGAGAISPSGRRRAMRSWGAFFVRFIRIAGPYWRSERRAKALGLAALLVALTIVQVAIPIALNVWTQNLFDSLAARSMPRFLLLLGILVGIIVSNVLVVTTHLRIKRRLQVDWRDWLTRRVAEAWMKDGRHYQVTFTPGEHDNPDGRIAEDVRITTEYATDLAHSLFYAILLGASFMGILWALSGVVTIAVGAFELPLPGHLVWVALAYSAIGTSVALLLGRPLVRATDRRQTFEANFRFGLVHAREHSLAIALARGEADERRHFRDLFRDAIRAWDRQTRALVNIFFYISSWSVLSQVFPVLIAAPRYIAGTITLGVLMQIAQAFQQMMAALAWPVDNLSKLADWRASVERVLGLDDAVGAVAAPPTAGRAIELARSERDELAFLDLSLTRPDGQKMVAPFSARIPAGDKVLIGGEPEASAALFKLTAGLWPWGGGRVELPRDGAIFFLPQLPYLPMGSLRAAIAYPSPPATFSGDALCGALQHVGLEHLVARLDETNGWEQALPAGEQQRIGFARLLLHRPAWIFIQEATDALDPKDEEAMMRLLQDELGEATVITIGHHPAIEAFHRRKLVLAREGQVVVVREQPLA